jgi:asparagine N-glycosylation enzyme membrane subunit Stt3
MPTLRALLYAAVPGVIVFLAFGYWIGVPMPFAVLAATAFTLAILYLTRVVHEEHEEELAAWAAAAPDLAPTQLTAASAIPGVGSETRQVAVAVDDRA